jgi:hypothetical protein
MPVTVTRVTIKPKPTKKNQSSSYLKKMGAQLKPNLAAIEVSVKLSFQSYTPPPKN